MQLGKTLHILTHGSIICAIKKNEKRFVIQQYVNLHRNISRLSATQIQYILNYLIKMPEPATKSQCLSIIHVLHDGRPLLLTIENE